MEEKWKNAGNPPSKIAFVGNEEKEANKEIDACKDLTLANQAQNFVDSVGIQGVRYIFMKRASWQRRYIWLIVLMTATVYTSYISYKNIVDYMSFPVTTIAATHFEKKLEFPAVTLCNYNVFQKSKLDSRENLLLQEMYSPYAVWENSKVYNETDLEYEYLEMDEIYNKSAFDYVNRINICEYQRKPCNFSHIYTQIRDIGYCMTFDPSADETAKYQKTAGRQGGLSLTMSVNPYDWSYGPFMTIKGFTVMVHDPKDEVVMLENRGFTIPLGHQMKLIVTKKHISLQSPPYGFCGEKELRNYNRYTQTACSLECSSDEMIRLCNCKREYVKANESIRTCDQYDINVCEDLFIYDPDIREEYCDCPPECFKIDYETKVTMAKVSELMQSYMSERVQSGDNYLENNIELQVYYPSLSYHSETEEPAYSFEKLLCDIGGAAGLFLGASFLTIFELIDFISYIFYMLSLKKCGNMNKNNISVLKDGH